MNLLMALDLLQININNNYGNRTTADGVIPLMPNPNISGASIFAGAHHFLSNNNTFNEAMKVGVVFLKGSKLMALDVLQINIHNNYGNKTTSDGVIPLMPNPSNRFTGRTEVIAKLKEHFLNTSDSAQKRKLFLLYGMGGIGKTQICLKFVEEMSDW